MYYFNSFLFENLPALFGMTAKDVSKKIYGNVYMYRRKVENQNNILVQDLVLACNAFRISMTKFISIHPSDCTLGNRFKYVIPDNDFYQIKFHPENIRFLYGPNGISKIPSLAELSRFSGISISTIVRWQNPEIGGCTVNWLVDVCNRLRIDIEVFLEDKNEKLEKYIDSESTLPTLVWEEISGLKEALSEYRKENRKLQEENRRLRIQLRDSEMLSEENAGSSYKANVREWTANWKLLENFHTVVGVSRSRIIQDVGMKYFSEMFIDGNMLVSSLVKLSNKYHISTRHFFFRDNGIIPELNVYDYYRTDDWKNVCFHPEYINDFFGKDSLTGINRSELLERTGISEWKLRSWRKTESTMRIKDMLDICNRIEITPFYLIADKNRMDLPSGMTVIEILLEENRMLRQQVIRLKEKIQNKNGKVNLPSDE